MTRAEFYDTDFRNCNFLAGNLRVSYFDSYKLKRTTFFKSNLELISVEDVKVWESNKWDFLALRSTSVNRNKKFSNCYRFYKNHLLYSIKI